MFENRYSWLDRMVHRIAFHTYPAQIALADLEDRMYAKQLAACDATRPVFITALPRAGTTLLLECLADHPEFASHRYRDMPFVLMPALWNRLTSGHRQAEGLQERAHGDGVAINPDSPEALEEVLWKAFWKKHYANRRITPWRDERDADFTDFLRSHMQKVIHIRCGSEVANVRYLSKNNANIARLALLRRMFPECTILLPVREPMQHAMSLLRQHLNFLTIQGEDPFALEYMSAIGHHDFGQKLYPIDFDGWIDGPQAGEPTSLDFWLQYWIVAYRHVLSQRDLGICFVSYEKLCGDAAAVLPQLAEALDVVDPEPLLARAATLHRPTVREVDVSGATAALLDEARELHGELLQSVL